MSLFDIIKGKDWGATLGSLADKAKSGASDLTRNTPGGMGGLDYLLAGVLAAAGLLLYHGRDRTVTDADRRRRMFGDLL